MIKWANEVKIKSNQEKRVRTDDSKDLALVNTFINVFSKWKYNLWSNCAIMSIVASSMYMEQTIPKGLNSKRTAPHYSKFYDFELLSE